MVKTKETKEKDASSANTEDIQTTSEPRIIEEKIPTPTAVSKGILEIMSEGYGFLRADGLSHGPNDIYISQSQIRRFDIRPGDEVEGQVRPPKDTERYFRILNAEQVNHLAREQAVKRKETEKLTTVYPNKQIKLETGKTPLSTRVIDLLAPVG